MQATKYKSQISGSTPSTIGKDPDTGDKTRARHFRERTASSYLRRPYSVPSVSRSKLDVEWNELGLSSWDPVLDKKVTRLLWTILRNTFKVKMIKLSKDLPPWEMLVWLYNTLQDELGIDFRQDGFRLEAIEQEKEYFLLQVTKDFDDCVIEPHLLYYDFLPRMRKQSPTAFDLVTDMLHLMNEIVGVDYWGEGYHKFLEDMKQEEYYQMDDEGEDIDWRDYLKKVNDTIHQYNASGTAWRYKQFIKHKKTTLHQFRKKVAKYSPKKGVYVRLKNLLLETIPLLEEGVGYEEFICHEDRDQEDVYYYEYMNFMWAEDPVSNMVLEDLDMKCNCGFSIKPLTGFKLFHQDGRIEDTTESKFPGKFFNWWHRARDFQFHIYHNYTMT